MGIQTDCGVTIRSTPSEIFKTLVTEDIVETISMQTNAFADKKICDLSGKLKPRSRVILKRLVTKFMLFMHSSS